MPEGTHTGSLSFRSLSAPVIQLIESEMHEERFSAGEFLMRQGDAATSMMVIREGVVDIHTLDDQGGRKHINKGSRGDVVGEMSLLAGGTRTASIVALSDVQVLVLPAERFHQLAHEHHAISVVLTQLVADRLGGTGPYLRGFESGNKAGDFHFGDDPDRADMMNLGSDVGEFDSDDMTYSMWFKTDNDLGNMRMLVNGSAASNPFLLVMHAGQLNVLTATGAAYSLGTKGVTYDDDFWHHVVAVRNGDVVADAELWIDGVDVSNTLQYISWFSMPASSALIGARDIGDYNNSFAGAIDEVSVWDRALTPDEIRGLFFAAITAVPEPASILLLGLGGLGLLCSLRLRRRLS